MVNQNPLRAPRKASNNGCTSAVLLCRSEWQHQQVIVLSSDAQSDWIELMDLQATRHKSIVLLGLLGS